MNEVIMCYPPNADDAQTVRLQLPVALQPYQLPDMEVPEGMVLNIKAWPLNGAGNLVYIGRAQGQSTNLNDVWPLIPNEAIQYQVRNANIFWASGAIANLFVCLTCEKRKRRNG